MDVKSIDEFEHQLVVAEATTIEERQYEEGYVVFGGDHHPDDAPPEPPLVKSGELPVDYIREVDGEEVERESYNY